MNPWMMGPIPGMIGKENMGKIGSGLGSFFLGDKAKTQQFPRYNPEQQDIMSQLMHMGLNNSNFQGIEDNARKNFNEKTIPSIAERFTGMGGGQRSSAFQEALSRGGSDLESQLGALKSQHGMQQLNMGMQPMFENAYSPATPGGLQTLLQSALPMLLKMLMGGM